MSTVPDAVDLDQVESRTWVLGDKKYDLTIKWGYAATKFQEEMGFNLLNLFGTEEGINSLLFQFFYNDEFMLKTMMTNLKRHGVDVASQEKYDSFLENLDKKDVEGYRTAFWNSVMYFFDPARRELLVLMQPQVRKMVKDRILDLLNNTTDSSLEDLLESQESLPAN